MTKFEVTLKQLRKHEACISGYNKVVCALKGIEYIERDTYIRFKHDVPISLVSIVESNGLDDALWCLRVNDKEWSRDSRLFAVWCARQVQHLMTDERNINALDVAEKFANGEASQEELDAANSAASSVASYAASSVASYAASSVAIYAASSVAIYAASSVAIYAAIYAASYAARAAARAAQKQMFIKMCNGEAQWQAC